MRTFRLLGLLSLFLMGPVGLARAQTDLSPLFAAPSIQEVASVRADWLARTSDGTQFVHEVTAQVNGYTVSRASFYFEGYKEYGLVRFPRGYVPGGSYPVLVFHHGGEQGLYYLTGINFDQDFPTQCLGDSAFVLMPTYRGEAFAGSSDLGNRYSQGPTSLWDRDCDDAMAMLTAFLDATAEADPLRVTSLGRSRGAIVAYHMAVRDWRVRRSVIMFGASDFSMADIQEDCLLEVDEGIEATNTLSRKVMSHIVGPWLSGEKSLPEARHLLTAWSIIYFLRGDLELQLHHGDADEEIPIAHAQLVDQKMQNWGAGPPGYEFFTYPGAGHNPAGMDGYQSRVEDYLCGFVHYNAAGTPPDSGQQALQVWPNPFTRQVLISLAGREDHKNQAPVQAVRILDLRGCLVKNLGAVAPGSRVSWDGTDSRGTRVPAGVYLVTRQNPGQGAGVLDSKRILLLR